LIGISTKNKIKQQNENNNAANFMKLPIKKIGLIFVNYIYIINFVNYLVLHQYLKKKKKIQIILLESNLLIIFFDISISAAVENDL
jgi:hypothetical protein